MDFDGANDRPRLSAEQKKKNHIESEKKRREAIRAGFERLSQAVPGLEGQARSEAVVLQRTVEFLREQLQLKAELKQKAMKRGMSEGDFEQGYVRLVKLLTFERAKLSRLPAGDSGVRRSVKAE